MEWWREVLLSAWLSFCFLLMTGGAVWAGDCSGPDDCGSVPDNNSRAAVGGGALVGGGLAYRSHRKKKVKDPCTREREAVEQAEDELQAIQSSIDSLQQQLAQLQSQVAQQIVQLQVQAASAIGESASNPALSGLVASLQVELQSLGDPTALLTSGGNPSDFFSTLSNVSNAMSPLASGAMALAQTGPFPLAITLCSNLLQLQGQLAVADGLLNSVRDLEDQLRQVHDNLKNAEHVLAECEASHSGDAQSQGDSAAVTS